MAKVKDMADDERRRGEIPEAPRDETVAMICGCDHPCREPIGYCCYCGGEVWPVEDECWDGAAFRYITFAYECYSCGHFDVAPCFITKQKPKQP